MIRCFAIAGGTLLLVAGCASAEHRLHEQLQERLDGIQGGYVHVRSHDPVPLGARKAALRDSRRG